MAPLPLGILALAGAGLPVVLGYELLETQVLSSDASSITISNIPAEYKHLQIRGSLRGTQANSYGDVLMRFNGDATNPYYSHRLYAYPSDVRNVYDGNQSYMKFEQLTGNGSGSNSFSAFVSDISDYSNTSKNTTCQTLWGSVDNDQIAVISNMYGKTNAVSSITMTAAVNNFVAGSRISVYGIGG